MKIVKKYAGTLFVAIILPLLVLTLSFLMLVAIGFENDCTLNQSTVIKYFLISLAISLVACVPVIIWFVKNIFAPVNMLNEATAKIKEGNLDVPLDYKEKGQLGGLCRNFDDMRKRLKDNAEEAILSDKESREMISNISHDLKTPITAIKGYVEGLLDNVVADNPAKKEKYIKTIYNKANDMDRLIDELTLYAKIGSNRATYNFRDINAKEYFSDCMDELRTELDAKGIHFELEDSLDENVCIVADPEYLKRVINNIISNSVKNMPPKDGKICIRLGDESRYVRVDISDNGKGISTKDLPHIFDRFYRGDASRNTAQGGSGIGLSIVKKVIEEHDGKIWVSSEEGKGTTMSFILKKADERTESKNDKENFDY